MLSLTPHKGVVMRTDISTKLTQLTGRCHCGNIEFHFYTDLVVGKLPVRVCTCSFCTKHAARYTSDPAGQIKVIIHESKFLTRYRHGTGTADFLVCARCGVSPLVLCSINNELHAIVNINALEDVAIFTQAAKFVDYDGETQLSRLERRKNSWISKVTVSPTI